MKIGVLADVHDDEEALETAANFLTGQADHTIICGDFILRPYFPQAIEKLEKASIERITEVILGWNRTLPHLDLLKYNLLGGIEAVPEANRGKFEEFLNTLSDEVPTHDFRKAIEEFLATSRKHTRETLEDMKDVLDKAGVPYTVIPGNYDPDLESVFREHDLHLKTGRIGDLKTAGYGGGPTAPKQIAMVRNLGYITGKTEIVPYSEQKMHGFFHKTKPDIGITHTHTTKTAMRHPL